METEKGPVQRELPSERFQRLPQGHELEAETIEPTTIHQVKEQFIAGTISTHINYWRTLTNNNKTIQIVRSGYKIEFQTSPTELCHTIPSQQYCGNEREVLKAEIKKLIIARVIEEASPCKDQVLSPVFLTQNKDGSHRLILNVKRLNEHVKYEHFKMEGLSSVRDIITKDSFLANIDLRKAYYSIPIHKDSRKYLRFQFDSKIYEYTCLPNGLSSAPRLFTKMLRVIFSHLRSQGLMSVTYIDDILLIGKSENECKMNIALTTETLEKAGFYINKEKSNLVPTKQLRFLGFDLSSKTMKISTPQPKLSRLAELVKSSLENRTMTIRRLSSIIGTIISILPAYKYGKMYYRRLESYKIKVLKQNYGCYEKECTIPDEAIPDLIYWRDNSVCHNGTTLDPPTAEITIFTDASNKGWGAVLKNEKCGEEWTDSDKKFSKDNINALELMAVQRAIKAFAEKIKNKTVMVRTDNTSTVHYINSMGGQHSVICNIISTNIWSTIQKMESYLVAAHIPGAENIEADYMSRLSEHTEWSLSDYVFDQITQTFGSPDVDLFASDKNAKCKTYVSWKKDNNAYAIDAFTIDWSEFKRPYIFPPFSLLSKITKHLYQKPDRNQTTIIVYPEWPAQTWYPGLSTLIRRRIKLPKEPFTSTHPLGESLQMMCGII